MPSIQISLREKGQAVSKGPKVGSRSGEGVTITGHYGRYFDFSSLSGKTGKNTLSVLQRKARKFGNGSGNFVPGNASKGNIGQLLTRLANWAAQHPDATWQVSKVTGVTGVPQPQMSAFSSGRASTKTTKTVKQPGQKLKSHKQPKMRYRTSSGIKTARSQKQTTQPSS